jgi:DNA-binding Xre family transcriptional regulator
MRLDVRAVKVLMAQNGIDTQKELARLIGLSANAVSELLQEKRVPSLDTIGALCRALRCTPNDILLVEASAIPQTATGKSNERKICDVHRQRWL